VRLYPGDMENPCMGLDGGGYDGWKTRVPGGNGGRSTHNFGDLKRHREILSMEGRLTCRIFGSLAYVPLIPSQRIQRRFRGSLNCSLKKGLYGLD